ncbi:MAG: class I SAM-dependent methyltransferase [Anaerolineaceae bacterium]|nr:class I SAM-dependent methyltransferase [Anaerolineaceae bacterium]
MAEGKIQTNVRQFYDAVGWQQVSEGIYQNAQYEDLRPVSREYIQKCHLRINRHLQHSGKYLLDAGSGPIQYPEYLSYSEGYRYRVCLDISIVALKDARDRIKNHGLFVVADIARLPFRSEIFDDVVSLHTIHHLPPEDYKPAYFELRRVIKPGATAVVVNGWSDSVLMRFFRLPMRIMEKLFQGSEGRTVNVKSNDLVTQKPAGTFVYKLTATSLRQLLGKDFPIKIAVWRSISVRFLRAMIHPALLGRFWLKVLYIKEELFPEFFGKKGQYPLITFKK